MLLQVFKMSVSTNPCLAVIDVDMTQCTNVFPYHERLGCSKGLTSESCNPKFPKDWEPAPDFDAILWKTSNKVHHFSGIHQAVTGRHVFHPRSYRSFTCHLDICEAVLQLWTVKKTTFCWVIRVATFFNTWGVYGTSKSSGSLRSCNIVRWSKLVTFIWDVCAFWGWISMDFLWGNIPSSWSTSKTPPKDKVFGIEMRNTCVLALLHTLWPCCSAASTSEPIQPVVVISTRKFFGFLWGEAAHCKVRGPIIEWFPKMNFGNLGAPFLEMRP